MRLLDTLRRLPQPVTAARLAAETEISTRQLYRDIATLRAGGVLVDGTAGYGYTLTEDPTLPPQSFSRLEIEALMLGVASLGDLGDAALTIAGRNALARIVATLPDLDASYPLPPAPWFPPDGRRSVRRTIVPIVAETAQHAGHADIIRESIDGARSMG